MGAFVVDYPQVRFVDRGWARVMVSTRVRDVGSYQNAMLDDEAS